MTHILLATLGTTPQVLTEAFYYHHKHFGITFDEVHVLTTARGARALKSKLLGPKGVFARMCVDLSLQRRAIKLGPSTIHVFDGADGAAIDDVRTTADGEALAEQMLEIVRRVCADKHATVHAIASGGRKVMSLYLNAMMQIAGRPQDKLFHLLVHPSLERQIVDQRRRLDYFYPRGPVRIDGVTIREEEQLTYIEVPLLTMSSDETVRRKLPWREIVRLRKREFAWGVTPPRLTIDPRTLSLRIGDVSIPIQPTPFFWYYAIAKLAVDGFGPFPAGDFARALEFDNRGQHQIQSTAFDSTRLQELDRRLREYHHTLFPFDRDRYSAVLRSALDGNQQQGLRSAASKLGRRLKAELGAASRSYETRARRGTGEYSISLPADDITILPGPTPKRPPPAP